MAAEKIAMKAEGTKFSFGEQVIGGLTGVGEVGGTADEIDVTTLDSEGGYKEFLQGFKDGGEVVLSGLLYEGESRKDIVDAFEKGTVATSKITFPDQSILSFGSWIKAYKVGPAEVGQPVTFNVTVRVSGKISYTAGTARTSLTGSSTVKVAAEGKA